MSNDRIKACLKNSSTLLKLESANYSAKQGAGLLNVKDAITCLDENEMPTPSQQHPQGYLNLSVAQKDQKKWTIEPDGTFKGIWFTRPKVTHKIDHISIDFYTGSTDNGKPLASFSLDSMPEKFFVPGTKATVRAHAKLNIQLNTELLMEYRAEAIDFRTLFCSGTKYLYEEGRIIDGSGAQPYSGGSDCKWVITAPEGKVIHFKFNEFDTEPRTDLVYFFNGSGTHEKIIAIFSGPAIPPELYSWGNKVLVWFVTNGEDQRKGWNGEFTFIDKEQAQYPTQPKPEN